MFSLLYVSTAAVALDPPAVSALAERAAAFNRPLGVTGLLVWNGTNFMQLLEGTEQSVRLVMDRIHTDPRHRDIVFLRSGAREVRECPDWSMREMHVPLTGAGSATAFTQTLPARMEPDTLLLFTSFASVLRPPVAALQPA